MACIVMAYIIMAYIAMACKSLKGAACHTSPNTVRHMARPLTISPSPRSFFYSQAQSKGSVGLTNSTYAIEREAVPAQADFGSM